MASIGANVRRYRLALGLSKEQLAARVGYANGTMIHQIEQGLKLSSTPLAALATALGVSVSDLVGDRRPCGVTNNAHGAHAIGYQHNEGAWLMTDEAKNVMRAIVREEVDARCRQLEQQLVEDIRQVLRAAAREADGEAAPPQQEH